MPYITNISIVLAIFLLHAPQKICDEATKKKMPLLKKILINVAVVSLQTPPFFEAMKRQNSLTIYILQAMKRLYRLIIRHLKR